MKFMISVGMGFLFSFGLVLSGMSLPLKVQGFLDVFGKWDASLLFVMGGALLVHGISYRFIKRMPKPVLDDAFHLPTDQTITPALVLGSLIFGIGWGLGGYCPGPAIASLPSMESRPAEFVAAMLVGMFLFKALSKAWQIQL